MNLQLKTIFSKHWPLLLFIIIHVSLFSINAAEWGDSYRMLRAAEYIKDGSYPLDEKRPPLFSLILALRPAFIEQVVWGRSVVFTLSLVSFVLFLKVVDFFIREKKYKNLAAALYTLNPVWLYWSIRVMSDVLFHTLVLAILYVYLKAKNDVKGVNFKNICLLGFLSGLSILTRFEGYLILFSLGVALVLPEISLNNLKSFLSNVLISRKKLLTLVATAFLTILPYLLYKSPLNSSYFEEPSGRVYDLKMVIVYLVSLIYVFGFATAPFFLKKTLSLFKDTFILSFTLLELLLILAWPAAIPRLFVPLIPVLVIWLGIGIKEYFDSGYTLKPNQMVFLAVLVFAWPLIQYILKLQFLVLQKPLLFGLFFLQILLIPIIYRKKFKAFVLLALLSSLMWALSPIYLHKTIFAPIKNAAEFVSKNLYGRVGYNDVSSVSDWYLNQASDTDGVSGEYYNTEKKENLEIEDLLSSKIDYLLITNEHNTDMSLDLNKRPYLEVIKDFSYNINGKLFFAKVVKINKEYK